MGIKKIVPILLFCSLLGGCAVGALPAGMTFKSEQPLGYDVALLNEVSVAEVTGGQGTNPLWTSEISGTAFQTALKDSLEAQGLLAEGGRFLLKSAFINVNQPFGGFDMTVTTEISYTLVDEQTGLEVMNESITAAHTATVGDAFLGMERLKLANEGSARKNIEQLLKRLSELSIEGQVSLAY